MQMKMNKLTHEFPPKHIYDECVKRFGVKFETGTIFTYGDKVHAYRPIDEDLYVHELTHIEQQKEYGAELWWKKYLADEQFRLEQEIEAYKNQMQYAKDNYNAKARKKLLKHIVECLSGKMYGNIISKEEAEKLFI